MIEFIALWNHFLYHAVRNVIKDTNPKNTRLVMITDILFINNP